MRAPTYSNRRASRLRPLLGLLVWLIPSTASWALADNEPWQAPSGMQVEAVEIEPGLTDVATLFEHRGLVFFTARGPDGKMGLWTSDGNQGGAERVLDLEAGSFGLLSSGLISTDDLFFFSLRQNGSSKQFLWASDGTAAGTRLLLEARSIGRGAALGNLACFAAEDERGIEPWCSDGTVAGTAILSNIYPGRRRTVANSSIPQNWVRLGSRLLFTAFTPARGLEWWVTRGTPETTIPLADVSPGDLPLLAFYPLELGDDVLFCARAPGTSVPVGLEYWLWKIRGEDLSIEPVAPLAGPSETFDFSVPVAFRGRLIMAVRDDAGSRLVSSDGTAAGTRVLESFGTAEVRADEFARVGNDLFFLVADGTELWATDGTREGTRKVVDLGSRIVHALTAVGSRLLFTNSDTEHGLEPWVSDGTAAGTQFLVDVLPGPSGGVPQSYVWLGDRVVFQAREADGTSILRSIDASQLRSRTCEPRPGRFCLGPNRYEVMADWRDPRTGESGRSEGEAYSDDTGLLWFFDEENLEVLVKVLDGGAINGHGWVFYGSLTDLGVWLSVADLETGVAKTYVQAERETCGGADTSAFPLGALGLPPVTERGADRATGRPPVAPTTRMEGVPAEQKDGTPTPVIPAKAGIQGGWGAPGSLSSPLTGTCTPNATTLCLLGGRFALELTWSDQRRPGRTGDGMAVPRSDRTGFFWFFRDANLELMVKVLDGRPVNGHFWVFYGSLTDVEFDLTVTDTSTGISKTYHNPPGEQCGRADTQAF